MFAFGQEEEAVRYFQKVSFGVGGHGGSQERWSPVLARGRDKVTATAANMNFDTTSPPWRSPISSPASAGACGANNDPSSGAPPQVG